jgi:arabinogalactan oligomer/maltooligosaccharide transport system permease protein
MAYIAFFYGSNDSSVHLYQQSEVDKAVILVGVTARKLAMIDDSELLQNKTVNLKNANDNILDIKILKLSGAKIIASTQHADEDKNFPFRLPKDQKSLFDKAKQIKAAYKKSLSGQFLNPIISFEWRETTSENIVQVIYPYVIKGDFKGVVQMDVLAAAKISQAYHFIDWLVLLALALALLNFFDKKQFNDMRLKYFTVTKNKLTSCCYATIFLAVSLLMCFQLVHEFQSSQSATINTLMELLNSVESESLNSNTLWIDRYGQDMQRLDSLSQPFYLQWMESNLRGLIAQFTAYILFSIFLLVFFVSGSAAKTRQAFKDNRQAYMYVLPAMLGMLVLVFFPFSYGVLLSFTDTTMFNESLPFSERFIGLDNYLTILGDFNLFKELDGQTIINYENFYWTLFITICWTVSNVVFAVGLGLLLALALNDTRIKFRWFFRVVLILPWAIPNYITALVWKGMFHQQFGVINQVIQIFGFEPIDWFGSVFTSFLTGLTTNVWLGFPFMMVVILGGLQSISTDMYEAAKIDGANRWQQFKYITLPSLKPTLIPAIILSVVWTFNMFNVIYLVSAGEPAGANEILITQAYKIGFEKMQYAYAAAYSVVIFMILLVYGVFQNKVSKVTDANS